MVGPQDGVDYLVRVADHVVNAYGRQDVHFVVIGDGSALESVKALARRQGVAGHFTFTGMLADDALLKYLSTADVCVSPEPANGFNEYHTMNKILEYMSVGKPIVAFELPETRRLAGEAALYAPPNDEARFAHCLVTLLDDEPARREMGRLGRQRIERELAWEHRQGDLLRAYEYVLGRKNKV